MSLPPGFLDELRARTSIAQVVGRKVQWDTRKSNPGKGDMWAPCPFHNEKTASFHVEDSKGFYYCFGCQAKGDAIGFVKETENVGFMEAVEILAREAGMTMPARDPQAAEKADRQTKLADVTELAARWFGLQLKTAAGSSARDYLAGRGLDEAAQRHWEIGFAPDTWQGLWDALIGKGISEELILGAGLAKPSDRGGKPYDTFRGRIMFPIRDARGRVIGFGGRAMAADAKAKYLNSPETTLFDKGRSLYNVKGARVAAGKGQPLLVAEGYMDVIALHGAGFGAAVAPLGTAVTETQLQMMWRIAGEPIVMLDGDAAGKRAALRMIDLALPMLEAGRSLRFALLPEGQDPDDLIKSSGAGAVQKLIDDAVPMVQLLWQRETEGKVFDSPERKAALDRALREKIALIKDPGLRSHYGQEVKDLRWALFRSRSAAPSRGRGVSNVPFSPTAAAKSSALAGADNGVHAASLREAVVLATCLVTPGVIAEFEGELEALVCADPVHAKLRDAMLAHLAATPEAVGSEVLENLISQRHVAICPAVRAPGNIELARLTVAGELAQLSAARGLDAEIAEAMDDLSGEADEGVTWRLSQAARTAQAASRSGQDDKTEYDVGANGARINKDDRSAWDTLLSTIEFSKPKGRQ